MSRKTIVQLKCDHCHRSITVRSGAQRDPDDLPMVVELVELAGIGDPSKLRAKVLGKADVCGVDCAEKTGRAQVEGMIEAIRKSDGDSVVPVRYQLTIAALHFEDDA